MGGGAGRGAGPDVLGAGVLLAEGDGAEGVAEAEHVWRLRTGREEASHGPNMAETIRHSVSLQGEQPRDKASGTGLWRTHFWEVGSSD
jgi:hypothetical protein